VVSNSRFVQNWANEAGAIGVITGTTTIDHSEFSANATHATETGRSECWGNGGAMRTGYGGVVTIDASTFAYNTADGYAAAIYHSNNANPLTIRNSTIVSNTNALVTPDTGQVVEDDGPGITAQHAPVWVFNTIVAGNRNSVTRIDRDCSGTLMSHGYTLIEHGDAICAIVPALGDQMGVHPRLVTLDFHGGFTRSFSLAADSPLIDAGPSDCGATDQRYYHRPSDGDGDDHAVCDLGAYEFGSPPPLSANTLYLPLAMQ
jgi:hypothetical protein